MNDADRNGAGQFVDGNAASPGRQPGSQNKPQAAVRVADLGSEHFARIDRRTREGAWLVRRADEHELQLGRSASPRERTLIELLVVLELRTLYARARLLQGEPLPDDFLSLSREIRGLAKDLGLRPRAREVRPLAQIISEAQESPQEPRGAADRPQDAPDFSTPPSGRTEAVEP